MRKSAPVIGPQLTNWSMVDSNLARGKFQSQVKYPEKFPTHIFSFCIKSVEQNAAISGGLCPEKLGIYPEASL